LPTGITALTTLFCGLRAAWISLALESISFALASDFNIGLSSCAFGKAAANLGLRTPCIQFAVIRIKRCVAGSRRAGFLGIAFFLAFRRNHIIIIAGCASPGIICAFVRPIFLGNKRRAQISAIKALAFIFQGV
jgi:hypothetical protein